MYRACALNKPLRQKDIPCIRSAWLLHFITLRMRGRGEGEYPLKVSMIIIHLGFHGRLVQECAHDTYFFLMHMRLISILSCSFGPIFNVSITGQTSSFFPLALFFAHLSSSCQYEISSNWLSPCSNDSWYIFLPASLEFDCIIISPLHRLCTYRWISVQSFDLNKRSAQHSSSSPFRSSSMYKDGDEFSPEANLIQTTLLSMSLPCLTLFYLIQHQDSFLALLNRSCQFRSAVDLFISSVHGWQLWSAARRRRSTSLLRRVTFRIGSLKLTADIVKKPMNSIRYRRRRRRPHRRGASTERRRARKRRSSPRGKLKRVHVWNRVRPKSNRRQRPTTSFKRKCNGSGKSSDDRTHMLNSSINWSQKTEPQFSRWCLMEIWKIDIVFITSTMMRMKKGDFLCWIELYSMQKNNVSFVNVHRRVRAHLNRIFIITQPRRSAIFRPFQSR